MQEISMDAYRLLLEGNRNWVARRLAKDPEFFTRLAKEQHPQVLWIGCSDSRVPANDITGTQPGDIFVHRNIANMVVHSDMNLLSVLDYAVNILRVKHVIVCGHYGCGGVEAAMQSKQFGLVDNWLRFIKEVYEHHREELDFIRNREERARRFVELNVIEQVYHLINTTIVQNSWRVNNAPMVHGWVYDLKTGLIKDLEVTFDNLSKPKRYYLVKSDSLQSVQ
jgi:carbonic anhydrase